MRDDLLPIGTFASRCRLSVKALRHYDELGLLPPAQVDVATGYRYYHRGQAPTAIAIALLRSLDVPLAVIRELLASENGVAMTRVLADERERQAAEIRRASSALRSIERLMRAGSVFPYEITERHEPARIVLVAAGTTTPDLHVDAGTELVRQLLARLTNLGRPQIGPVFCLLTPRGDDALLLQMCTAIADPPPGAQVLELPATAVAATHHVGAYEELGLAEHSLYAWAEARGCAATGPIREVYRNDPAQVAAEALETEVLLPISRPSDRTRETEAGHR